MTLVCSEPGCPLATDGRCLEQFPNGVGCPHTRDVDDEAAAEVATDIAAESVLSESTDEAPSASHDVTAEDGLEAIELGGDLSMSIDEAELVAARYGARVALIAGAFESGKTSLVAGLYGLFLDGPVDRWNFAGSTSLIALDGRFHARRAATGLGEPDQAGTRDEDMRLLDLRLWSPEGTVSIMFSDVRGEYFEDIAAGGAVGDSVPLAQRADRAVLVLDGEQLEDTTTRAGAVHFIELLIGGLTEPGGLRRGTPVAFVLTKADKVGDQAIEWFETQVTVLSSFAAARGLGTSSTFVTAALPSANARCTVGLEELLGWCVAPEPAPLPSVTPEPDDIRTFLSGRGFHAGC